MLDAPTAVELGIDEPEQPSRQTPWWQSLQATGTRRGLLLTALGGLLIAGLITALPSGIQGSGPLAATAALGLRGNDTFDRAKAGDCLGWTEKTPDAAQIVACSEQHRFEVAEIVDMRTFPGIEYGPNAAPPNTARIQQITQEQCQAAARQYLGAKFDPDSRFVVSLLWSGEREWRDAGERRMMCGLQLPGPNGQQLSFKGRVADVDQSKVWSAGTCVGIDATTAQPTDIPVDCSSPHATEVTGMVNLAERFPDAYPADVDQDAYVKDACAKTTDAYLAPRPLRATTLTLMYSTISLPSWTAGSHQVSCSIGATLGNGGWSTLLGSAKADLRINGQPVVPPPDIPEGRLNLPPVPLPSVDTSSRSQIDLSQNSGQQSNRSQSNQHLPAQGSTQSSTPSSTASPTSGSASSAASSTNAPPPPGNTFLNGPPLAPGVPQDGPPPEAGAEVPPPGAGAAPAPGEQAPVGSPAAQAPPGPVAPPAGAAPPAAAPPAGAPPPGA